METPFLSAILEYQALTPRGSGAAPLRYEAIFPAAILQININNCPNYFSAPDRVKPHYKYET
jgi:hypothetical protein